jgi:choline dehydrogenase
MHDFVIVGGGTAGCVLASRLTEDGRTTVLLLEAGAARSPKEIGIPAAWPKLLRSAQDWGYRSEVHRHLGGRRLLVPRGKTLGGCSATNTQMYLRGHRDDYDAWARLGNAGWGYDDVLPYFRRSEHNSRGSSAHHGVGGPLAVSDLRDPNPVTAAFVRACAETGIPENPDLNGAELDGVAQVQVTQRAGRRCSTADAFLGPARRRSNLEVVTAAYATRILFDGPRATGVEYLRGGRRVTARAAGEVLVAAARDRDVGRRPPGLRAQARAHDLSPGGHVSDGERCGGGCRPGAPRARRGRSPRRRCVRHADDPPRTHDGRDGDDRREGRGRRSGGLRRTARSRTL